MILDRVLISLSKSSLMMERTVEQSRHSCVRDKENLEVVGTYTMRNLFKCVEEGVECKVCFVCTK